MSFFNCCTRRKLSGKLGLCSSSDTDESYCPPARTVYLWNSERSAKSNTNPKSENPLVSEPKYDDHGRGDGLQTHQLEKQNFALGDRKNQSKHLLEWDNDKSLLSKKKHYTRHTSVTIRSPTSDPTQQENKISIEPDQGRICTSADGLADRERDLMGVKELSSHPNTIVKSSHILYSSLDSITIDSLQIKHQIAVDRTDSQVYKSGDKSMIGETTRSSTTNGVCDRDTERVKVQKSSGIHRTYHPPEKKLDEDASSMRINTRGSEASLSSSYEQNGAHMTRSTSSVQVHQQFIKNSISQVSSSTTSSRHDYEKIDTDDVDWEARRIEVASNIKRSLSQNATPMPDLKPQMTSSIQKQSHKELLTTDADLTTSNRATIEADLAYFRQKLRNDVIPMHDKHKQHDYTTPQKRNPAHIGETSMTSPGTLYNGMIEVDALASVSASTSYSNTPGNQTPESTSFLSDTRGTIWNGFYDDCIRKPYETDLNLHNKRSMPNCKTMDLGAISSVEGRQFNLTSAMSSESSLATEPLWNTLASVFDHNHSRSELDIAVSRFGSRQVSLANLRSASNYRLGSTSTVGLSLEPSRVGDLDVNSLVRIRQAKVHDNGLPNSKMDSDAREENKVESGQTH